MVIPIAEAFGNNHCEKMLLQVGFRLVFSAAWPSVFFHPKLKLLLAVYVDDFKDGWAKGQHEARLGIDLIQD